MFFSAPCTPLLALNYKAIQFIVSLDILLFGAVSAHPKEVHPLNLSGCIRAGDV
jgi:hypothetical protein